VHSLISRPGQGSGRDLAESVLPALFRPQKKRARHLEAEKENGGERPVGQVVGTPQQLHGLIDGGRERDRGWGRHAAYTRSRKTDNEALLPPAARAPRNWGFASNSLLTRDFAGYLGVAI
jgi:hypothetical protein